jgi:hypothetical protein
LKTCFRNKWQEKRLNRWRIVSPLVEQLLLPSIVAGSTLDDVLDEMIRFAERKDPEFVRVVLCLALLTYQSHRYQDLSYEGLQFQHLEQYGVSLLHIASSAYFTAMAHVAIPAGGNSWDFTTARSARLSQFLDPLFEVVDGEIVTVFLELASNGCFYEEDAFVMKVKNLINDILLKKFGNLLE